MSTLQDVLTGKWNQVKGKLKEQFSELTDDDLLYQEGKENQLIGKLQEQTGKTKAELIKLINEL